MTPPESRRAPLATTPNEDRHQNPDDARIPPPGRTANPRQRRGVLLHLQDARAEADRLEAAALAGACSWSAVYAARGRARRLRTLASHLQAVPDQEQEARAWGDRARRPGGAA